MSGLPVNHNHSTQDDFHITVVPSFIRAPARILPKPRVTYGNKKTATVDLSAAWRLQGLTMSRPTVIPSGNWGWLYVTMIGSTGAFQSADPLRPALESFQVSLRKQGIKIGQASERSGPLHLNNEQDPALEIRLRAAAEKGLDLLLIIMPAKNTALFSKHKSSPFTIPSLSGLGSSSTSWSSP